MISLCKTVFGKAFSELDQDEKVIMRRAVRAASYYRDYERNKAQNRKNASWRKVDILKVMGWPAACSRCGYDKYIGALDFHHIDPHTKDGVVQSVAEARKCVLLCANCHREAHRHDHILRGAAHTPGGRPQGPLHPLVEKWLTACGITRPSTNTGEELASEVERARAQRGYRRTKACRAWA